MSDETGASDAANSSSRKAKTPAACRPLGDEGEVEPRALAWSSRSRSIASVDRRVRREDGERLVHLAADRVRA